VASRATCSAVAAPLTAAALPARFVVLEGLAGVGKSTIAPLLAAALDADLVDTQLPELTEARRYADGQRSVNARLHFWLMANYAVSEVVRSRLRAAHDVVIESYFYRTLATHAAMGVRSLPAVEWDLVVVPDLAIELTLHEPVRQRRLAQRKPSGPSRYWSDLAESDLATLCSVYDSFDLTSLDTTGLTPAQVVDRIQRPLVTARAVMFYGAGDVC
jgi:thymidylate kinase